MFRNSFLLLALAAILISCSSTKDKSMNLAINDLETAASSNADNNIANTRLIKEPVAVEEIDFYIARGQLLKSEYEHYTLTGDTLIAECGELKKAEGSRPEVTQIEKRTEKLSSLEVANLKTLLEKVSETHASNNYVYPPSESAYAMNAPGVSELTFVYQGKGNTVKTSFDELVDSETPSLSSARELLISLRSLSPKLCGNLRFFGI